MTWILILLLFLYMLEGIPYGIQSRFLPLILRSRGLSLTALGLYKLLYIPWLFKSFYAPLIDTCLTKRLWLLISISGLLSISLTFSTSQIIPQSSETNESGFTVFPLSCCLFLYNLCAATQDIAVDSLALLILSTSQLSAGNTIQVVGYKLGAVLGGGVLTTLASYIPVSQLFWIISAIYALGILLCCTNQTLVAVENHHKSTIAIGSRGGKRSKDDTKEEEDAPKETHIVDYFTALRTSVVESSGSRRLLVLLLLYKLGEQGSMNMLPLFLFDGGNTFARVGFWTGFLGQITSVAGSAAGYLFLNRGKSTVDVLSRLFIARALFQAPLVLIATQNFTQANPDWCFAIGVLCMNTILFVSGAITTVMFTLMMQCTRAESDARTQATHYTILSTAELLGKLIFGLIAAPLTDLIGYASANAVFLVLSIVPVWFIRISQLYLNFVKNSSFGIYQQ